MKFLLVIAVVLSVQLVCVSPIARRSLLSLLSGNYVLKQATVKDLNPSIPVRVTGYAFFDGHHWSKKSLRGNKHSTRYTASLRDSSCLEG